MTYTHDTVIREYLSGKVIQYLTNDKWVDLPVYSSRNSIPMFTSTNKYRVKPNFRYSFFHCGNKLFIEKGSWEVKSIMLFNFPEYKPSGEHIMLKTLEGKVIETKHSPTDQPAYSYEQIR